MTVRAPGGRAPRAGTPGARALGTRYGPCAGLLLLLGVAAPPGAGAQVPPEAPDTLAAETLPADTVPLLPLQELPPGPDTLVADTLPVDTFPRFPVPGPTGWGAGVWDWDREALLARRGLTLADLLRQVPGVLGVRGGDYGAPVTVTALGGGGGRTRVFWDGFEMEPLDGAVPDLSRIGAAGLARVRVERRGGEVRVHLWSVQPLDPTPLSLIEAGTGDLDTNVFRGTFAHPRVLGGSLALALDRVDTRGTGRSEPGSMTGGWLRYALARTDRWGVAAEVRRMTADRGTLYSPGQVTRSDAVLRGRYALADGILADVFWGRASVGQDADSPDPLFRDAGRTQAGVRLAAERARFWAVASVARAGGDGLPGSRADLEAGARHRRLGGVSGIVRRESWEGTAASRAGIRAWSVPVLGVSLFGEVESGRGGVPYVQDLERFRTPLDPTDGEDQEEDPPAQPVSPSIRFTDRTVTRGGAELAYRGLSVAGAWVRVEADSVHPLGIAADAGGPVVPVGSRIGFEAEGRVPLLLLDGLVLAGSVQLWEDAADWPYFPARTYDARLAFHDVFLPTGNFELWVDLGVEGRDGMLVPLPASDEEPGGGGLSPVPFYQSWYARLQMRIVTVRLFVAWENLTVRQRNQDFPERILPHTRATYGVRWTLWN